MPRVHFTEAGTFIDVCTGTTVLEAARAAGLALDSPCNQTGVCGKCRIRLSPDSLGRVQPHEQKAIPLQKQAQGWVLACNTIPAGDIEVVEIPESRRDSRSVLQHGQSTSLQHQPFYRKHFDPDSNQTLVSTGDCCLGRETGNTIERLYGVAVDIGTTTVVASLIDLHSGQELAAVSEHNPQSRYAQDVLSRISFAGGDNGLQILKSALQVTLNSMLSELCDRAGILPEDIYELVFSGNTCMLHLATGTDPAPLGRHPYTPQIHGHQSLPAKELGLNVSPFATVYLPPILSAYVGADITSGILSLQLHRLPGLSLLIDIGTNGEIVLAEDGRLTATSTAAGPALEGMNISCGMCAGPGAIESVCAGEDTALQFKTIDDAPARGLCGSGLIDLVATLVKLRVIEASGRFAKPQSMPPGLGCMLNRASGSLAFQVTPEVALSQKDVRQVQLAKGAIRTGIDQLLTHTGVTPERVDRVLIAGAFGYHLCTESLVALKILPAEFADKLEYVGNTSKTGGQSFLTSAPSRQEMAELAKQVKILELSGQNDFERHFVRCLSF